MSDRRRYDVSDYMGANASSAQELENLEPDPAVEHLIEKFESGTEGPSYRLKKFDPLEARDKVLPQRDYVLPGLKPRNVGLVISPGAVGKSFLSLQTAFSIAVGFDPFGLWGGGRLNRGKAVYVNLEDEEEDIEDRWQAINGILGDENKCPLTSVHNKEEVRKMALTREYDDLIKQNFEVWLASDFDDEDKSIAERLEEQKEGNLTIAQPDGVRADYTQQWREFIEYLASQPTPVRLIIIDTFTLASLGLDHNEARAMSDVIQILKATARILNCAVIINHHANKSSQTSSTTDDQTAGRGSTTLTDNCRWQINLSNMSPADGEKRGLDTEENEHKEWVSLNAPKRNNVSNSKKTWLRRSDGGVLVVDQPPERQEKGSNGKNGCGQKNNGGGYDDYA